MATHTSNKVSRERDGRAHEAGLTVLEVIVAMLLLTIGLLGVAAAVAYAVSSSNMSRNVTSGKQNIVSILEQMENLRNTRKLTFGQISNAGAVDNTGAEQTFAGFPTGFQSITNNPGPDGIFGTSDDLIDAGPDGVYGTSDDFANQLLALPGYSRQIAISNLNDNLKKIEVTLKYPGNNGTMQQLVGVSYLNNDARGTFQR